MKYRTHLLAYVLTIAVFFAAGYGAGMVNGLNRAREEITEQRTEATEEALNVSAKAEEDAPEYSLVLENGRLIIYEIENENKTELNKCKISESVYPKEDITALKSGMVFDDKNAAMAMFENFAS